MRPLIAPFRMIRARATYHQHDGRELLSAILAGVFGLLAAFVEFVAAAIAAVRMSGASA